VKTLKRRFPHLLAIGLALLLIMLLGACNGDDNGDENGDNGDNEDTGDLAESPIPDIPITPEYGDQLTQIAFAGEGEQGWDIFVVAAEGGQAVQLTDDQEPDANPAFSPDGEQIVYEKTVDGIPQVWVMAYDGENQRTLANDGSWPDWSPDGRQIVFSSTRDLGPPEIYVMDVESGITTRLTENEVIDDFPFWGADGEFIYFTSEREGEADLYRMRFDGSDVEPVYAGEGVDGPGDVSPQGGQIAMYAMRDGAAQIVLVDLATNTETELFSSSVDPTRPAWSPNGEFLAAFTAIPGGDVGIYITRPDGTGLRFAVRGDHPAWGVVPLVE
jgi:TolB protein